MQINAKLGGQPWAAKSGFVSISSVVVVGCSLARAAWISWILDICSLSRFNSSVSSATLDSSENAFIGLLRVHFQGCSYWNRVCTVRRCLLVLSRWPTCRPGIAHRKGPVARRRPLWPASPSSPSRVGPRSSCAVQLGPYSSGESSHLNSTSSKPKKEGTPKPSFLRIKTVLSAFCRKKRNLSPFSRKILCKRRMNFMCWPFF